MALKPEIARVFAANFEVYGLPKVWRHMQREGFAIARCTVERRIQSRGWQGLIRGRPIRTVIPPESKGLQK